MIKIIKFLILFFSTQLLFSQSTVTISGKITNPRGNKVYIRYFKDYLTYEEETADSSNVGKAGKFSMTFAWSHPFKATLVYGQKGTELYLNPGDSLKIKFDALEFDESIKYTGIGSNINNYLEQKYITFSKYYGSSMFKLPENKFTEHIDSIHDATLNFFNEYFSAIPNKSNPVKSFMEIEELQINYDWADNKLSYPGAYRYYNQLKKDIDLPNNYYDFLKKISVNNPNGIESHVYLQFLNDYINYEVDKIKLRDTTKNHNTLKEVFIEKHFTSEIKDFLIAKLLYDQLTRSNDLQNIKGSLDKYKAKALNQRYVEVLDKTYAFTDRLSKGNVAPDFSCLDIDGKTTSLSNFKGKLIYLDIWASWCAPCILEMPYSIKLEEEMKGKDIVFLYVSLDENKPKWKNTIRDKKMKGHQFIAIGSFDSQVAKLYNVKGIPHYVLIDKDGKIINANAKNPSNLELKKELEEIVKNEKE